MKPINSMMIAAALVFGAGACAEEGDEGTSGIDCGDHGAEHDGHCHCDDGWLFDGETCVDPAEIAETCEEHEETDTEEHHDEACVCPEDGDCPCDGDIVTYGGVDYCEPALHEE
jgi:hypothetical protein